MSQQVIGRKLYEVSEVGTGIYWVAIFRRSVIRWLRSRCTDDWFLVDTRTFADKELLDDWLSMEEVEAQSPSFRIGGEHWHVAGSLDRSLNGGEEWHFQQIGIWSAYRRLKASISLGRNKLNRYVGYQSGVEVAGSWRFQYAKCAPWIGYFTLTVSLSWAKERLRK